MTTYTFTPFPQLSTPRVVLRPLLVSDAASIFSLRSDPAVNKYITRPKPATIAEVEDFIEMINAAIAQDKSIYWVIALKNDPAPIGTICLWNFSNEKNCAELGYELLPKFQGQGLMREAIKCVVDYVFTTLPFGTIDAYTHRDNTASIRLLEKIGFTRADSRIDPEDVDNVVYCLSRK
jgi:[ribosomal protein S5]-alanine N-acetyltransferase